MESLISIIKTSKTLQTKKNVVYAGPCNHLPTFGELLNHIHKHFRTERKILPKKLILPTFRELLKDTFQNRNIILQLKSFIVTYKEHN